MFECIDEGTIDGKLIQNRITLLFDVSGGRVSEFREHIGIIL